jgi:plasmid stabilization system protein ParE
MPPKAYKKSAHLSNVIQSDMQQFLHSALLPPITAEFPEMGRIVPEYKNPSLREKILGDYRIVYRLKENSIEIVIIVHGSRLLIR